MSLFGILSGVLVIVCTLLYYLSRRRYDYWKKKNIPYVKPKPLVGNYGPYLFLQKTVGETVQKICQQFPNEPVIGAFYGTEPTLIVQDPELIKLVTTKDYYYFSSREVSKYTTKEVFTQNLFFTYGDKWKVLRQNLSPIFSSAKMKNMFHLIEKCSKVFERIIDEEIKTSDAVDIRSLMARFTMDCIGGCAFGVDTKALEQKEGNPFFSIGHKVLEVTTSRASRWAARAIWPAIFYGLGLKTFPTEADEFFHNLISTVFKERKETGVTRNDFVDLLLGFKDKKYIVGDKMENIKTEKTQLPFNDDLLVSQCMSFFIAGYETSATTSSFTLYEIAKHPEVQERVLNEVDAFLKAHGNKLTYDCVTELPYLDQCISEALRLYPVLTNLTRELYDDYTFPNGLRLEKGMRVHLPVYHLHMNPKYFPDPEQFRPERFSPEEKKNLVPYTYMPFGEGPRLCIGMRFAKMQMISGLITILKKYRVVLAEDMPRKLTLEPKAIVLQPSEGIRLKFIPREGWEQRVLV